MKLIEFSTEGRSDYPAENIHAHDKPIMIFLGGLLHIQDLDTAGGFAGYLAERR